MTLKSTRNIRRLFCLLFLSMTPFLFPRNPISLSFFSSLNLVLEHRTLTLSFLLKTMLVYIPYFIENCSKTLLKSCSSSLRWLLYKKRIFEWKHLSNYLWSEMMLLAKTKYIMTECWKNFPKYYSYSAFTA